MPPKVVIVGSFNADLTAYMEHLPKPGETLMGKRFIIGPGGKGSNQAIAAARLGADVTFIGRLGRDQFAEIALDMWQMEGINTNYVVRDLEHSTGVAPIWVEECGQNAIVVVPGANMAVCPKDIDAALDMITTADVLVTQLEIPIETAHYALQLAKSHGVRTIFNPAPAIRVPDEMMALADLITPNESELTIIAGGNHPNNLDSARTILTRAEQTLIVTLGAQGARWVTLEDTGIIPTHQVEVVDTTGAGDAFNGALAVALAEGQSVQQAIGFANATAALSVTREGTAPSMPTRTEVDTLLKNRSQVPNR